MLDADDSAHLVKVRRAQPGDRLHVSDGVGTVWDSVVESVDGSVTVELKDRTYISAPIPRMTIFQAVAKADKNEQIVQKLVEVGVDEVVMFTAERSIPRWDTAKVAKMAERLAAVAREAAKQSRRPWLPTVRRPVSFREALRLIPDRSFIAQAGAPAMRALEPIPSAIGLIVGPEGGLTDTEAEAFRDAGAIAVGLGSGILRAETAGLVLAVVARRAFGLM